MNRRAFMQGLAGGSALFAAGLPAARAFSPSPAQSSTPTQYKVLEIYLDGGLSAFCTLLGRTQTQQGGGYQFTGASQIVADVAAQSAPWLQWSTQSLVPGAAGEYWNDADTPRSFKFINGLDALVTSTVPFRVCVMKHQLEPHEAARPFTLTGNTLGRPHLAGMGNAVNHIRPNQHAAYILHHNRTESALEATQPGQLGGASMPVVLQFDRTFDGDWLDTEIPSNRLDDLDFDRQSLPTNGDLRDHYIAAYKQKLMKGSQRVRSKAFDAFAGSWARGSTLSTAHADVVRAGSSKTCLDPYQDCAYGLVRAAASLLNRGAHYAMVIAEGFDTHSTPGQSHRKCCSHRGEGILRGGVRSVQGVNDAQPAHPLRALLCPS
ncbi:MAG: hypothetical protein AAFV53_42520 [Myxococcota bacterium]